MRFTVTDLTRRGFKFNRNIPGFTGFCTRCNNYALMDWWQSPPPENHQVVACRQCQTVDRRDEDFVRRYPVMEARTA